MHSRLVSLDKRIIRQVSCLFSVPGRCCYISLPDVDKPVSVADPDSPSL